jgi:hemerythrin-like metal-binding protein
VASVILLENPELDGQHQHLEEVLKGFEAAVLEAAPVEQVYARFSALVEETRRHFASEEQLMQRDGYEGRSSHTRQHQHLLRCLGFIRNEYTEWKIRPDQAVVDFLWRWLNDHISISDREYAEYVRTLVTTSSLSDTTTLDTPR